MATFSRSLWKRISSVLLPLLALFSSPCSSYSIPKSQNLDEAPKPTPWPLQFHSILFMNYSGSISLIDLWYDWPKGRNFNIIQDQLGELLYDLEWTNGTSFLYTLDDSRRCRTLHVEVGILRPNWLDGAEYLGQERVGGFLCNVWQKVDFIWYYEDVVTKRPVHWVFYTGAFASLDFFLASSFFFQKVRNIQCLWVTFFVLPSPPPPL